MLLNIAVWQVGIRIAPTPSVLGDGGWSDQPHGPSTIAARPATLQEQAMNQPTITIRSLTFAVLFAVSAASGCATDTSLDAGPEIAAQDEAGGRNLLERGPVGSAVGDFLGAESGEPLDGRALHLKVGSDGMPRFAQRANVMPNCGSSSDAGYEGTVCVKPKNMASPADSEEATGQPGDTGSTPPSQGNDGDPSDPTVTPKADDGTQTEDEPAAVSQCQVPADCGKPYGDCVTMGCAVEAGIGSCVPLTLVCVCVPGFHDVCDDGNPCTANTCTDQGQCVSNPAADGTCS